MLIVVTLLIVQREQTIHEETVRRHNLFISLLEFIRLLLSSAYVFSMGFVIAH